MKKTQILVATLLGLALSTEAHADLVTLHADIRAGAAGGKGMFGGAKDLSFQEGRGALAYGLLVGAELFFVDAWIEHDQYVDGGNVSGTWTQFMLGLDMQIGIGALKGFGFDDGGKKVGGYDSLFLELGAGAGYGVGTGQQVDPPLNNSQVTDKGFLFESHAMLGYRLTQFLSLGLDVPVQFGYFTKSGDDVFVNVSDNHYAAVGAQALITLRGTLNLR